jgi:hypothetical protein
MVKLIILGGRANISSLKSHLPAAVFLFWLPQGDAAKKEKKLHKPVVVLNLKGEFDCLSVSSHFSVSLSALKVVPMASTLTTASNQTLASFVADR